MSQCAPVHPGAKHTDTHTHTHTHVRVARAALYHTLSCTHRKHMS